MIRKVVVISLKVLGVLAGLFLLNVITPVTWSSLNRNKAPVGYHFMGPAYVALWSGIEKLVNPDPAIPEGIEIFQGIEYKNAGGRSLQLDIYRKDDLREPAPLLVFIHGGAWKGGERSDYLVYLIPFASRGFVTATVSYRLLSDSLYPACVEDIRDAVGWFFRNGDTYGYDTSRIALIGGSAGAHLATLAAYGWPGVGGSAGAGHHRVKAVVDIYGPVDLTTEYARNHPLVTAFIGRSYEEVPDLYADASPVTYLDSNDPPTLILHGTSDRLVPVSQSENLKARLDSLGVPCTYYPLPLWPHTMDIVKRVNDFCRMRMEEFFVQHLL